jgi:hypothetical protein
MLARLGAAPPTVDCAAAAMDGGDAVVEDKVIMLHDASNVGCTRDERMRQGVRIR